MKIMSKSKTAEAAAPTTEQAPVVNITADPQTELPTAEQQANVQQLNEKTAPIEPPKPPTRDELQARETAAFDAMVAKKAEGGKAYSDAKMAWWKAGQDVEKFDAAAKAEADKLALTEKLDNSKNVIAEAFGITREKLDEVLNTKPSNEQGVPNPVFTAIQTLFGKPVVFAKQGQTGVSLAGKANGTATPSGDGTSKSDEILALMQQGWSYNQIYNTGKYGDGTIRTVAGNHGFVKSVKGDNDSAYAKKA